MSFDRTRAMVWLTWSIGVVAACTVVVCAHRDSPIEPAVTSSISNTSGSQASRCIACHAEIVEIVQSAPHWNALDPGSSKTSLDHFAGQTFIADEGDGDETTYEFSERDGQLWCRSSKAEFDVQLHWVFGSGRLAQTPVALQRNARGEFEMIEHRVSWYPGGVGLGLTLGQNNGSPRDEAKRSRIALEYHGTAHDSATTLNCFACHSSKLDPRHLDRAMGVSPGLACRRCHADADSHADEQEGLNSQGVRMGSWSQLTQREAVNQCGECHRRADQTPHDEITTSAEHIVRFAPVGLVQSACFLATESSDSLRLDCMTCHDPHRAASRDVAFYSSKCRACHDRDEIAQCSREPKSENCVSCHMKRRETQPHLIFTDHWIR